MSNKGSCKGLRVFYNSPHASIEYDMALIYEYLGMTITRGNLSRDNEERPTHPLILSSEEPSEECKQRHRVDGPLDFLEEDFKDCDVIQIINPSDFQRRVVKYSEFRPAVVYINGQWIDNQLNELAGSINKLYEEGKRVPVWIAVYSRREYNYLFNRIHTEIRHHLHHIRFAKRKEDYEFVSGDDRLSYAYTTCHSIHHRGGACNYEELKAATEPFPWLLSGRHTEEIGGMGLISFDEMRFYMSHCGVYVGVPCWPAPIVLNVIEAMFTGAPVTYHENQRGMAEEGLFEGVGSLTYETGAHRNFIRNCLRDKSFRSDQSHLSRKRAIQFFDFPQQADKWGELFKQIQDFIKSGDQV